MQNSKNSKRPSLIEFNVKVSPRLPAVLLRLLDRFMRPKIEPAVAEPSIVAELPIDNSQVSPATVAERNRGPRIRTFTPRPPEDRLYWISEKPKGLSWYGMALLECLDRTGVAMTRAEICRELCCWPKTVNMAAWELEQRGLIERLSTPRIMFRIADPTASIGQQIA